MAVLTIVSCKPAAPAAANSAAKPEPAAGKPYPIDVCLVSGEKLGSMGEPVVVVKEGQQIKFCCEKCQPEFEKAPAKYLAKLPARP